MFNGCNKIIGAQFCEMGMYVRFYKRRWLGMMRGLGWNWWALYACRERRHVADGKSVSGWPLPPDHHFIPGADT